MLTAHLLPFLPPRQRFKHGQVTANEFCWAEVKAPEQLFGALNELRGKMIATINPNPKKKKNGGKEFWEVRCRCSACGLRITLRALAMHPQALVLALPLILSFAACSR